MRLLNRKTSTGTYANDWSEVAHLLLNIALPIVLLLLVRLGLIELSILLALFSKWRVFTVKPRHLIANIKFNAIDIVVKLSTLSFIIWSKNISLEYELYFQLGFTVWYIVWLTLIKPRSGSFWIGIQALAGQFMGLSALLQLSDRVPELTILFASWLLGVLAARHYLSNYEEQWLQPMSYIWGLFVAELSWVLYRWQLVYIFVPQIALIVTAMGYALMSLYHAHNSGALKKAFIRQQTIMTLLVLAVIIAVADWWGQV